MNIKKPPSKCLRNVAFVFIAFLTACTNEFLEDQQLQKQNNNIDDPLEHLRIDPNSKSVSAEDAKKVALFFANNKPLTKGIENKQIKAVVTVCDSIDNPLVFIANFENKTGFVIISATKKFDPILAHSDEGNYSLDNNSNANLWLGVMKKEIIHRMAMPDTFNIASWAVYEKTNKKVSTKTVEDYQNIEWWRAETMYDILYTDKYPPQHNYSGMGVLHYESFYSTDQLKNELSHMMPSPYIIDQVESELINNGYNPNVAFYHVKYFTRTSSYGPLLKTYWHQNAPYNKFCPINTKAGCVPVAIAQIMNHHKWPSEYAHWSIIGYSIDFSEEAKLIGKVGQDIGMAYGENQSYPKFWQPLDLGDLSQSKKFFKDHQYAVTKDSPKGKLDVIARQIITGNPVYMEGTKELFKIFGIRFPSLDAHAWVCDGYYRMEESYIADDLYLPQNLNPGDLFPLAKNPYIRDSYRGLRMSTIRAYFHMNWGWGKHSEYNNHNGDISTNNGWFLGANISELNGTDYTVFYRFLTANPIK